MRKLAIQENDIEKLRLSIAAYRLALEIFTRENTLRSWIISKNGLAGSLRLLGQWERNPSLLKDAIAIYDEILKETSRERAPGMWASIILNRALAAAFLAETLNDRPLLDAAEREALDAHEFAKSLNQEGTARYGDQVLDAIARIKSSIPVADE